jgi:hypothetical protein
MNTDAIVLAILGTRATYYHEGDNWQKIVEDTKSAFVNLFPAADKIGGSATLDDVPF